MRSVVLPSGERIPALGLGTWCMGENPSLRDKEIATIRSALDLGVTLIDTAEMYGEGRTEELIGEALSGRRDEAFLVSKVYPHNASRKGIPAACERSLRRLRTERLDLYLLHWPGSIPLEETIEAFMALQATGKIRFFGVSNFDPGEMKALWKVPGGEGTATNQVLYNLTRRGIEWDLLPWMRERGIPTMAYSPIERGRLLVQPEFEEVAVKWGMTPTQLALAWLLSQNDMIVIPKTSHPERLKENVEAVKHELTKVQLRELDELFPAPKQQQPLEML